MTKEEALEKLNILIISNNECDYEEVRKMGFKNISYFKSIIVADKYFKDNPDELAKYNLIITGEQKVQRVCFHGETDLNHQIDHRPIEVGHIYVYNFNESTEYDVYFNCKSYSSDSMEVIMNMYLDMLLEHDELCAKIKSQETNPLNISEVPKKDYPTSKKDLHVLFLVSGCVNTESIESSAEELGMDVTFIHDSNSALGKSVIHHIGEYDIIIASNIYSGNLINMNEEFTEQGKLTGLRLGVVATYENESIYTPTSDNNYTFDLHGYELLYKSALGGIDAQNKGVNKDCFRVLKNPKYLLAKSLIERALVDYHCELKLINGVGLNDVDPDNFKHYSEDYKKVEDTYEQEKEEYLNQVRIYDSIVSEVKKYLHNKEKGRIKTPLNDLSIKETEDGIIIEAFTFGRRICVLTLSKNEDNKNRIFYLQTMKENGSLTGDCELSLYPVEKKLNIARPNEKQMAVLSGLWKKIEKNLVPINDSCAPKALKKTPNNRRKPHYKKTYKY